MTMDSKTRQAIVDTLVTAAASLSAAPSAPDKSISKHAKNDVETEILYLLSETEQKSPGELLDEVQGQGSHPSHPSRIAGMSLVEVEKVLKDLASRGLVTEVKNSGTYLRNKMFVDRGEIREGVIKALQMSKALGMHLEKLLEQVPTEYEHYTGVDVHSVLQQALEEIQDLTSDIRELGHSFE